jgi:hypothetical protein
MTAVIFNLKKQKQLFVNTVGLGNNSDHRSLNFRTTAGLYPANN